MTTEQKAKAYDEAKARMSRAYNSNRCTIGFMNEIFPELKESNDEKIRKWLIDTLKGYHHLFEEGGVTKKDMLFWLEKQGNQKPTDNDMVEALRTEYEKGRADAIAQMQKPWSEEDEKKAKDVIFLLEQLDEQSKDDEYPKELIAWVKSFAYKKYEWSEYDKDMLDAIEACYKLNRPLQPEHFNWLKSLKERYTWKPSDEQMEVLVWCLPLFVDPKSKGILESLINDLKKLKGK